ncbi:MAG: alpha/beta fold hydrolase [Burkholderiaceae bacterium]
MALRRRRACKRRSRHSRDDLLAVLDAAGVAQAVLVGISLGGMTALQCVLDAPDRVLGVVACNCRASIDAAGIAGWDQRLDILKGEGIDALAQATLARWFAQDYRDANPEVMARVRDIIRRTAPAGYESCIRAIQQVALASRIDAIDRPVLLVAGAQDGAAPPAAMQAIADSIPGARLEVLDPCGHLSAIQQPDALATLIDGFCRTRHGGSLQ